MSIDKTGVPSPPDGGSAPPQTPEERERARKMFLEQEKERKRKKIPAPKYGMAEDSGTVMMKKGGKVSASRRADGIVQRGKTKGRLY